MGREAALVTVQTIQNRQPICWMPIGVISTMAKLVILSHAQPL